MTRLFLSTCLAAIAAPAFAQSAAAPPTTSAETAVGEIVVTAQRRSERLQDVPVAVTAFDQSALQARQVANIVDIMTMVPNLHVSNNIGQGSATTAFLRGVGETESIISIDTPVGFYLDDVYIGRQGVNNMALFDVDRIEVLRGPQGTLYGRNTSAGAIKVVTKRPDFTEAEGLAEASYGRFDAWSLKGSVNAPLSSDFAVRANALVSGGGGNTYNRTLDTRVNDAKFAGFRLAARYKPTADLDINIAGDWSRNNENGTYGHDIAGILRPAADSVWVASSGTDTTNIGKAWGLNGTVDWSLGDGVSLKSITAYRRTDQRYNLDLTDQPVPVYVLYTDNRSRQFSQELQLSGKAIGDRLTYVAGLFYFDESSTAFIGDQIFTAVYFRKDLAVKTKSYAGYAQLNYQLTDRLGFILGGRYTRDEKTIDIVQKFGGTPGFDNIGGIVIFDTDTVRGQVIPARPGRPVKTDLTFNKFTPKVGIEFKPNDDVLLYASYTQGFKSGGWSARVTSADQFFDFDPETINSYEIGVKSTVLDKRATINVTGFYYDYKNLFNTGTTNDGGFGIATSDAKIYGIEIETNWQLAPGIRAFANGAWQDAERKGIGTATIALGDQLQRLPHWSGSIGVTAKRPLIDRLNAIGNIDYSYTSKHFINPQNTPAALTGPISLVNASIGMETTDERWGLTIGCRNCFAENYNVQILDFASLGFITVYPGPRSQWTVTGRARF
jgi:iron complex outermembrane receptor protein